MKFSHFKKTVYYFHYAYQKENPDRFLQPLITIMYYSVSSTAMGEGSYIKIFITRRKFPPKMLPAITGFGNALSLWSGEFILLQGFPLQTGNQGYVGFCYTVF